MGNHHYNTDHASCWSSVHGCKHYSNDTKIISQKWKTVPISEEEAEIIYRRVLGVASKFALEATSGLSMKRKDFVHDAIEVSHNSLLLTIALFTSKTNFCIL